MTLRRATDLLPGHLYSRRGLREQGMHPRVLASDEIATPVAGYCSRADAPAPLVRVALLVQTVLVPGSVISHATAAELLGLPLPLELTRAGGAPLHCTILRTAEDTGGGRRRTRQSLVVHAATALPSSRLRGLDITPPLEVLRQIASKLSHDDLVACLDSLAARRHGAAVHVPLPQILADVSRLRGPGSVAVRRAATDARAEVWSPMETRTRLLLRRHGFPEPTPNLRVREEATGRTFVIDLAYPAAKVAVEYDSEEHRLNRRQWQKDLHKNEVLHQLGWSVVRLSVADLLDPADAIARLTAAGARNDL